MIRPNTGTRRKQFVPPRKKLAKINIPIKKVKPHVHTSGKTKIIAKPVKKVAKNPLELVFDLISKLVELLGAEIIRKDEDHIVMSFPVKDHHKLCIRLEYNSRSSFAVIKVFRWDHEDQEFHQMRELLELVGQMVISDKQKKTMSVKWSAVEPTFRSESDEDLHLENIALELWVTGFKTEFLWIAKGAESLYPKNNKFEPFAWRSFVRQAFGEDVWRAIMLHD